MDSKAMGEPNPVSSGTTPIALLRLFLSCLLLVSGVGSAFADVIYYNRISSLTSPATLRRVNADGTGDQPLQINLPAALNPTASRSGRFLLVTSPDPGRPFKISNNVFLIDLLTGGGGKLTRFEDVVSSFGVILTNDLGNVGNRVISGYTANYPYHKALSPDGTRIIVMNLRRSASVTADTPFNPGGPNDLTAASGRFPAIEIYRVSDAQPEGSYVFLGIERTGFNQGGDGIDWHPSRNEIIATVSSDIPAIGTAGRTGAEGTVLAVITATGPGQVLRFLTAPVARFDAFLNLSTLITSAAVPHDYAPSISPDGQRVAYVRHVLRQDSRFDGAGIAPMPAQCSVRVVNYNGSGDREVIRFNDGWWVTRVSWSPDSNRIAFDLAPQMVLNGWNSLLGDVSRSEVYVVNSDGSGIQRVAAAPASYPSWAPRFTGGPFDPPPMAPRVEAVLRGNTVELRIGDLTPGRRIRVEGVSVLGTPWFNLLEVTPEATQETFAVEPSDDFPIGFYRVLVF